MLACRDSATRTLFHSRSIANIARAEPSEQNDVLCNYALLLRLHGDTRTLSMGMVTHDHLIRSELEVDVFLGNLLVQMYGKCGALEEAHSVLTQMHEHDVFVWTFIISAYAHAGQASDAVQFLNQMQHEAVVPSSFTLVEILCACGKGNSLVEGQYLHASIMANTNASGIIVENALLNFYGKRCDIKAAQKVFVEMGEKDVVSWNTMLTAHNRHGLHSAAHQLFQSMLQQGFVPNKVTYSCLCDACISQEDLSTSRRFHSHIIGCKLDNDVDIGSAVINMYARCGCLNDAFSVFYKMYEPDVVSWTTLVTVLAQQKRCKEAVALLQQMLLAGVLPNDVTFLNLISACSSQEDLRNGKRIHAQEHTKKALDLFQKMCQGTMNIDRVTLLSVLQSIGGERDLREGKLLHAYIHEVWDCLDSIIGSILVNMYSKCGILEDMQSVFDQMPDRTLNSWTALIFAYGQDGQNYRANQIFEHMKLEGIIPDELAFSSALSACNGQEDLARGKLIHACILDCRTGSSPVVSNALLGMYISCGSFSDAENAFKKLFTRNVVTWNTIINACVQSGHPKRAFCYFKQMMVHGVLPNMSIYASLLSACAFLAALAEGRRIHELLLVGGVQPDVVLGTAIVNFYGKCGSVEDAQRIFERMPQRNVAAWNSIIATFCHIGDIDKACTLFVQMQDDGIRPDEITFLTIVSSFSHAGLVDEALNYFLLMAGDNSLVPTVEHYNCLIDLFGRAGCLDKVEDMLAQVSFKPDLHSWMSLLSACRVHVDVKRGEGVVKSLSRLELTNRAPQVLMSNIYAAAGRFEAAALVRNQGGD
ncbi:hypothetical protein GOP47_0018459 [Adiantum capillus-veneris]|uniref:Pentatricopeptide repeat-containing protein n=1 Tax=Adiantum capillus-veneris TaxID=13818 RepID=A0A9D4UDK7_ADICA|nr:hypothetical protein GOP47_0018459 [Adiantum capillus-veneris]